MAEYEKNPPRKKGRPKKSEAQKRDYTVKFRVNTAEYFTVKAKARAGKLSLSEYARRMALDGQVSAPVSGEELALVAELTREKNNLNQLAKVQNAAGAAKQEAELLRIIRFYDRVIAKLKNRL